MRIHHCYTFLILFASLVCLSPTTLAQDLGRPYSTAEKVGFGFFHLLNRVPDFEAWAKNLPSVQTAQPEKAGAYYELELLRLKQGFFNFNPEKDLITLNTTASLLPMRTSQGAASPDTYMLSFSDLPVQVFPYTVGNQTMALFINDLEKRSVILLLDHQKDDFAQAYRTLKNDKRVAVSITLKLIRARAEIVDLYNGLVGWPVFGDIAQIRVIGNQTDQLWSYTAPWHDSKTQKALR